MKDGSSLSGPVPADPGSILDVLYSITNYLTDDDVHEKLRYTTTTCCLVWSNIWIQRCSNQFYGLYSRAFTLKGQLIGANPKELPAPAWMLNIKDFWWNQWVYEAFIETLMTPHGNTHTHTLFHLYFVFFYFLSSSVFYFTVTLHGHKYVDSWTHMTPCLLMCCSASFSLSPTCWICCTRMNCVHVGSF